MMMRREMCFSIIIDDGCCDRITSEGKERGRGPFILLNLISNALWGSTPKGSSELKIVFQQLQQKSDCKEYPLLRCAQTLPR